MFHKTNNKGDDLEITLVFLQGRVERIVDHLKSGHHLLQISTFNSMKKKLKTTVKYIWIPSCSVLEFISY